MQRPVKPISLLVPHLPQSLRSPAAAFSTHFRILTRNQFSTASPHSDDTVRGDSQAKGNTQTSNGSSVLQPSASIADIAVNLPRVHGQRRVQAKGVFIDDLQATVEAQKTANRNPLVRRTFGHVTVGATHASHNKSDSNRVLGGIAERKEAPAGFQIRRIEFMAPEVLVPKRYPIGTWDLRPSMITEGEAAENQRRPYQRFLKANSEYGSLERSPLPAIMVWETRLQLNRLDAEIKAFDAYMQLTPLEAAATQKCIDEAIAFAARVLPSAPIVMHGSRATGLAGPFSDINFCVMAPELQDKIERGPSPGRPEAKRIIKGAIRRLEEAFQKKRHFKVVQGVQTSMEAMTAIYKPTGLLVKFVANLSAVRERNITSYHLEEHPQLRPLFMIIDQALKIRGLTSADQGGAAAYPLLIMILTALRHAEVPFRKGDLGLQLLHVLEFWAQAETSVTGYAADPPRTFQKYQGVASDIANGAPRSKDTYDDGFDILGKTNRSLKKKNSEYQSDLLCLQDPGNPTNDLGKRIHHIKRIQEVFRFTAEKMKLRCVEYNSMTYDERQRNRSVDLIGPLVDARYNTFIRARAKLTGGI